MMSEITLDDYLKFYKKNEKEIVPNIDNLFIECIIHNYEITSIIKTLQKLVILRSSFNELAVSHFGENGILQNKGTVKAFEKDLALYTFYNNKDNRIDSFDYSIDNSGNICTYSVDFKPQKGKLKSMNMLFNNDNIEKLLANYYSGNRVNEELEMYISTGQLKFFTNNNAEKIAEKELTKRQFFDTINKQRKLSSISRLIDIPKKAFANMKNKSGLEY